MRKEKWGGRKGASSPISFSPYLLTISHILRARIRGKRVGDTLGRDAKALPSRLLSRISFRSFRSLGKRKGGVRRIRRSPIITPLNAFLLAHPSQMGAAVNIRETAVSRRRFLRRFTRNHKRVGDSSWVVRSMVNSCDSLRESAQNPSLAAE